MDVTLSAKYSSRPSYTLNLRVWTASNDVANNRSYYNYRVYARSSSSNGSYFYDCRKWYARVANDYPSGCAALNFAGGGDYNGKEITLGQGNGNWIGHDGNGYLNFVIAANHNNCPTFGSAGIGDSWVSADRLPKVPSAPGWASIDNVTTTGFRVRWGAASDNGAGLDAYLVRISENSDMSNYSDTLQDASTYEYTYTGLTPGKTYYIQVYAHNSVGFGPSTQMQQQSTIPATPPGLSIVPALNGRSALATMTPPGNVSGVTKYGIGWREVSNPGNAGYGETTSTQYTVSGQLPGSVWEYRAKAFIDSYESPWSNWVAVVQPNPNTNPGDYFDGSTAARADTTFVWTGTANASVSAARAPRPTAWNYSSANTLGQPCTLQRATGGAFGAYSAKLIFFQDQTDLAWAGPGGISQAEIPNNAPVEVGALYWGSLWVNPSRSQSMRCSLVWISATGSLVGVSNGTAQVAAGGVWTRVTVSGIAPAGAVSAFPVAADSPGTPGHSMWLGGEYIFVDAGMVTLAELFPYFDGNSQDGNGYEYDWMGTPNASVSTRTYVSGSEVDPLLDPDCPPAPEPPRAPQIEDSCIIDVGTWRRYWEQIPASEIAAWNTMLPTMFIRSGVQPTRQVRIRIYENPSGASPSSFNASNWVSEQILSYVPPNTEIELNGIDQRVWAYIDGESAPRPADKLLYGSNGEPATWPELGCGQGYLLSFDVPLDAPVGNVSVELELTRRV